MNCLTKVIILVFILGLGLAWMFRYSAPVNLGKGSGGTVTVTDRWTGCVVFHRYMSSDREGYKPRKSCP